QAHYFHYAQNRTQDKFFVLIISLQYCLNMDTFCVATVWGEVGKIQVTTSGKREGGLADQLNHHPRPRFVSGGEPLGRLERFGNSAKKNQRKRFYLLPLINSGQAGLA
ncbi:MAG: hypothetical protein FWG62_05605, partial [Proteobacteria bacterium]|nr:hypothetical protein [Pseudomonadota bacterium]